MKIEKANNYHELPVGKKIHCENCQSIIKFEEKDKNIPLNTEDIFYEGRIEYWKVTCPICDKVNRVRRDFLKEGFYYPRFCLNDLIFLCAIFTAISVVLISLFITH